MLVAGGRKQSMNALNVTPGATGGAAVKDTGVLYPLMLVAAVGVIVFSIAGIATMMGWIPGALTIGSKASGARSDAPQQIAPRGVAPASACRECGIVESLRVVEAPGESSNSGAFAIHESGKRASTAVHFEIRVRMSDGASRTLYERTRPSFTVGQKVRVTEQGVMAAG
jgi:hypothetical protein